MAKRLAVKTLSKSPVAREPFQFFTSLILQESTGLRAATIPQLVRLLREVPESCVYHHTHYFLLQHHYLAPEPKNDFAYWTAEILGEPRLGELLAGVDTMDYSTLGALREALIGVIERYLEQHPTAKLRFAGAGEEFFFLKSVHVIMPTPYHASTLAEFTRALERVSIRSLYFHMFDARLRVGHATNDFSKWLGEQLNLQELAEEITRLDPYAHTLEHLRGVLLRLIKRTVGRRARVHA